jgi:hypothetical protein
VNSSPDKNMISESQTDLRNIMSEHGQHYDDVRNRAITLENYDGIDSESDYDASNKVPTTLAQRVSIPIVPAIKTTIEK